MRSGESEARFTRDHRRLRGSGAGFDILTATASDRPGSCREGCVDLLTEPLGGGEGSRDRRLAMLYDGIRISVWDAGTKTIAPPTYRLHAGGRPAARPACKNVSRSAKWAILSRFSTLLRA